MLGVNDAGNAFTPLWFSGSYLGYAISGSEQMRLTSTGLGIGTSSPGAKLDVYGTSSEVARIQGGSAGAGYLRFADTTNTNIGYVGRNNTSDLYIWQQAAGGSIRFGTVNAQVAQLDAAGNLGLGVTPSGWNIGKAMQIGSASDASLLGFSNSAYLGANTFYNGGWIYAATAAAGRYQITSGAHSWFTAPSGTAGNAITFTQALTLDASGRLLLGTTSALGTSNGAIFSVKALGASNTYFATVMQDSSGNNLFSVRSDGYFNTGVGSLSPYNNTSASVANVYVDSSGFLYRGGVSALKYKQDVRDLESIDISKFRAVRYKSKCANDDQTIDYFGFIADEVDAAGIKELVSYENGEIEGFQYDRMTAVLLKALQDLKSDFDAYKATHP
jgi:hypothetical protein